MNTRLRYFFSHLHDGEHAGFMTHIVERLKPALSGIALVATLWENFEKAVTHETLMFKMSKASPETQAISETDKARDRYFREVRHRLKFYAEDEDTALKHAADALLFLLKPYEDAAERSLFEETTFIRNFLSNVNQTSNAQNIGGIPGLNSMLVKLEALNNALDALYTQRLQTMEELKALGKRTDVRMDADMALMALLVAINSIHHYLELSGEASATKTAMEQSAEFVNSLIDQLRKVHAHRTHSRRKPSEATQTAAAPSPTAPKPAPANQPPAQNHPTPPPANQPPAQNHPTPPPTNQPPPQNKSTPAPPDKPPQAPAENRKTLSLRNLLKRALEINDGNSE
ncbi:MAG: DUF6261 family protein [Tannerellaceae bacterium]|nr:DUF6261 family protein [Tannerellaceae bacterium]